MSPSSLKKKLPAASRARTPRDPLSTASAGPVKRKAAASPKAKAPKVKPALAKDVASMPSRIELNAPRRLAEAPSHKFSVGDTLTWQAQPMSQARSRGTVTVVMRLPALGSDLQYRIRTLKDTREFVVLEHELSDDPAAIAADAAAS